MAITTAANVLNYYHGLRNVVRQLPAGHTKNDFGLRRNAVLIVQDLFLFLRTMPTCNYYEKGRVAAPLRMRCCMQTFTCILHFLFTASSSLPFDFQNKKQQSVIASN